MRPLPSGILGALRRHLSPRATTFWNLPTRTVLRRQERKSGCRSILRPFSVPCVRSALRGHTIFDPIFGPIPTSALSSAPCAAKHLPASMIGSDTKVYTAEKRSLCAKANWGRAVIGAVGEGSHARMLSGAISDPRRAASASNRCWTRRRWSGNVGWSSSRC